MKKLIVCLFGLTLAFGAHTYARELLPGDYVTMGKYSEAPIVWRCVDINENGALMLSDRIITCKAFDAAGDHVNDAFGYRKSGGGGTWSTSALRKWLNSAEETVDYGMNPPVAEHVTDNAYSGEPGFLNVFSQSERELLNSAEITSVINGCDAAAAGSGTQEHIFKAGNAVQNYSDSYVQTTTDKVFLPGVRELQKIRENRSILGALYERAYPTQAAVSAAQTPFGKLSGGSRWFYWLRDSLAYSKNNDLVRCMFDSGAICYEHSNNGAIGVRPMFYLNTSLAVPAGGDGSEDHPYTALNGPWIEITEKRFYVEAGKPFSLSLYKEKLENAVVEVYIDGSLTAYDSSAVLCGEGAHEIFVKAKSASGETLAESDTVCVISVKYNVVTEMLSTGFEGGGVFEGFAGHGNGGGRFETVETIYGTSLRMVGIGATSPYLILPSLKNASGMILLEGDFFFENSGVSVFSLKTQPGNVWLNLIQFTSDGAIAFTPKDKVPTVLVEEAELNQWYHIKMIYDIEKAEASVFVNNKSVLFKEPSGYSGYQAIDYVNINTGGAKAMVLDNLHQCAVAEVPIYEITSSLLINTLFYTECNNGIADFRSGGKLNSNLETVEDDAVHGKALKLTSTGNSGDAAYVISPLLQESADTLMIEAEYKFSSAGRQKTGILNVKTQPDGKFLSLLNLTENGEIVLSGVTGGARTLVENADSEKWYKIRCIYSKSDNTVRVVIDGSLLAEERILYTGYAYFDYVNINGGATTDGTEVAILVDNVRITEAEKIDDARAPLYATVKVRIIDNTKSLTGMKIITSAKKDGYLLGTAVHTITGSGEFVSVLEGVKEQCLIETYLWDGFENIQPFEMEKP